MKTPVLGIQSHKGDHANPDGDRHVVAQRIQHPDRTDGGKRDGQENDQGLDAGLRVGVEQQEDQQQVIGRMSFTRSRTRSMFSN